MYSADNARARELRLMARLYAERGDEERARQALEWTKDCQQFPKAGNEEVADLDSFDEVFKPSSQRSS